MPKTILSIKKPTPAWANYVFRTVLLMATTLNTAIVAAPGILETTKLAIVYWSGVFVTFIWSLSRTVGIKPDDDQPQRVQDSTDPKDPLPPKP